MVLGIVNHSALFQHCIATYATLKIAHDIGSSCSQQFFLVPEDIFDESAEAEARLQWDHNRGPE